MSINISVLAIDYKILQPIYQQNFEQISDGDVLTRSIYMTEFFYNDNTKYLLAAFNSYKIVRNRVRQTCMYNHTVLIHVLCDVGTNTKHKQEINTRAELEKYRPIT